MAWEYAVIELIECLGNKWQVGAVRHGGNRTMWVLRTNRRKMPRLEFYQRGEKGGKVKSFVGAYFVNDDSLELVKEAAKAGWEMTSGLPVGFRTHFDNAGIKLGGYNTIPMMRRRVD
jgi:hypothetical protein